MKEYRTLAARYVFPVAGDPIEDGTVILEDGRIVAVTRGECRGEMKDLGSAAILPGWINAHVHLELSGLERPLGAPGLGMADWIRLVMAARPGLDAAESVRRGLEESARAGVAAVGEIAQAGWMAAAFATGAVDATVFQELIGPTHKRSAAAIELARHHLETNRPGCGWRAGLSPHAPYTVHRELLDAAVQLSARRGIPLAFHLAESREEMELLRSESGPLRELLEEREAWEPGGLGVGRRALDYLRTLAGAERALVIHGNYLDEDEIAYLGRHAERMSVVYCPRTHVWFRHGPYPLARMLAEGAVVALGTDSRASAPDLDVLAEIREAARAHPSVASEAIVRMATWNGARALGVDEELGTLEPGKWARLAIVPLAERDADPYELLLEG